MAALLLSGCGPKSEQTADTLSGGQKVEAIASTLQACSYDGRPVAAEPAQLTGPAPAECSVAVCMNRGLTAITRWGSRLASSRIAAAA
ncbi:MAG: hypothetical protein EOP59_07850, partial [Sphingomonadales bacterium]